MAIDTRVWLECVFVVFVRKVPGRPGSTKVQLAERRAGRDVVLAHIGTARSEAELAVLVAEAQRRLRPGQQSLDLGLHQAPTSTRTGVITGKRSAGPDPGSWTR
jgi:hypothetical protein